MVTTTDVRTLPGREQQVFAGKGRITPGLLEGLADLVPRAGEEDGLLEVRSPFTGELIGQVQRSTDATVERAARRARQAQREWAERSFEDRGAVFTRYHDLMLERREEILDLIQLESGKARKHAFEEVADVAIVARYYALYAGDHIRPQRRKGALPGLTATWEYRHPKGLVGVIAPWNYPLSMAVTDAIPALMAGNAVLLKPDQQTPFTALWAVDLLQQAGLPLDLVQVITGKGSEIGTPLIQASDFVTFTGSTATGRLVARQAADRLIGCSLELGGKNAMIVLEDADLDAAVEGALRGCFANAGQLCISIERLYLDRSIHRPFVARFVERTARLEMSSGLDYDADLGSLASAKQLETVRSQVDEALAMGARALTGGRARPDLGPYFYEPTILENVTDAMTVATEETFGPVVSVYSFDTPEEALELANASRYGLNASIWTRDTERGVELAKRIQTGTVNVNEAYAAAWASVDAPMGGFKDSGLGRRHGRDGILKYTEPQTVALQRGLPLAAPPGVGEEGYSRLMSQTLKLLRWIPGLR
jgi:succinate-semialdehyde dehydrogenase/glutarate-semialdehyde dehydrogenase